MKASLPGVSQADTVIFPFSLYKRYRRFTQAKPLRKAFHLYERGYDSDTAESQAIALVLGSLRLLTHLNQSSHAFIHMTSHSPSL